MVTLKIGFLCFVCLVRTNGCWLRPETRRRRKTRCEDISTRLIKKFYSETKGKIKIIGVGGVDSGESAFEKITSGADAVQLYTGMVYKGPGIVKEIKKDLISILKKENLKNVSEAVGINA